MKISHMLESDISKIKYTQPIKIVHNTSIYVVDDHESHGVSLVKSKIM